MAELYIQSEEEKIKIALVEDEKIVEYYEESDNYIRREGNIYIGIVKDVVKGMQAAFIDLGTKKNSFIYIKDVLPKVDETKEKIDNSIDISKILQSGQKLLVQIKKDSNEKKGARISTHINLPGKYIALMPNTDIVTISQKIENQEERERLKKLVKENLSEGNGAVVRTLAEGKNEEIIEDIKKVEEKWENIIQTSIDPNENKPKLLYKSEDIIERMLIDLTEEKLKQIIVNDKKILNEIKSFQKRNTEFKNIKIKLEENNNILEIYNLEKQITKLENRKIWLNCGGFITIDKTEALTAIDVNTGKYVGKKDLEETVYKVNKEATTEIAKQLRLRDIGGIIIIDYIDMKEKEHKKEIEKLLKKELKKDRSKTQVEGFTKLDLMELTRKHICSHKEDK